MISGNMVGAYSQIGKTFVLTDADGNELTGVVVGQETVFDATDDDVRLGSVYAGDSGVSVGTKVIPAYHTTEGYKVVPAGSAYAVALVDFDAYDYTRFQALICDFNSSIENSVATSKVVIGNNAYETNSTVAISDVVKNHDTKTVEFGLANEDSTPKIIRFFTYKETN